MENRANQIEDTIDLKNLLFYFLRRWKVVLLAILIGAFAWGVKMKLQSVIVFYSDEELQAIEVELQTNKASIESSKETVDILQDALNTQEAVVQTYQESVATLKAQLEAAESDNTRVDLVTKINSANNSLLSAQTQVTTTQQKMKTAQDEIDALEDANETLQYKLDVTHRPVTKQDILRGVKKGAVAGGGAILLLLLIIYLTSGKLRKESDMKRFFGFPILGYLYYSVRKRGPVTHLLNKLEGYPTRAERIKAYDLAAAAIEVRRKKETERIMVTGTLKSEIITEICENLREKLPENGYDIIAMPNPVYNAEALRKLRRYSVIVIEGKEKSRLIEIAKLSDLLKDCGAVVMGTIVL